MATAMANTCVELRSGMPTTGLLEREDPLPGWNGQGGGGNDGTNKDPFPGLDDPVGGDGTPKVRCMDVNLYATKKSVAQGLLDIALLTANASQLRFLLQDGPKKNPFYTVCVACVSLSISLQLIVGILLIFTGRYNINKKHHQRRAEMLNNGIIFGVFLITVVNVFISAFSSSSLPDDGP